MNRLINFIKTTAYVIATILSICLVFMVVVVSTAQASEPTALERVSTHSHPKVAAYAVLML